MSSKTLTASLSILILFAGETQAQRGREPMREGAGHWAMGLAHPEARVRSRSMSELRRIADRGGSLEAAVPTLKKCATRQMGFPQKYETDSMQREAFRLLARVEPDFAAPVLAAMITSPMAQSTEREFARDTLMGVNAVSVNIDMALQRAVAAASSMTPRDQANNRREEGKRLYLLAKLGKDRDQTAKVVLSRMRWPLADRNTPSYYSKDHFRAVRLCAEGCEALIPALIAADRMDQSRKDALAMLGALAVYHDAAWEHIVAKVGDRFEPNYRLIVLTAYADTWLLASEKTREASKKHIQELTEKYPDWGRTRMASRSDVPRLQTAPDGRRDTTNVLRVFREKVGYEAPAFTPRPRRR